jgi:hypothetical protein
MRHLRAGSTGVHTILSLKTKQFTLCRARRRWDTAARQAVSPYRSRFTGWPDRLLLFRVRLSKTPARWFLEN